MTVQDITPDRRRALRRARSDGYVDGSTGAAFGHRRLDAADDGERAAYETGWHVGRHEKLDIPVPSHVSTVDAEDYARSLYCEEAGESLTVIGSGGRFGFDTPGRDGEDSPRRHLAKEMGDVLAAVEYACLAGLVDRSTVEAGRKSKLGKLLSPASRDNLGRRLAPPPQGFDGEPDDHLIDVTGLPDFAGFAGQAMLLGRRIIRYMPELGTEYPDDVFAGWQLDDQDTWLVLAHPSAADQVAVDDTRPGRDMTFIDHEIVSMTLRHDHLQIVAVGPDGNDDVVTWTLSPDRVLGHGDDLRRGLVLMRRPREYRDR